MASEPGSSSLPPRASSPRGSSDGSLAGGKEHPVVAVTRLSLTAGGAVVLGVLGLVPPLWCLGALVAIAIPTHAGKLIDLVRGPRS